MLTKMKSMKMISGDYISDLKINEKLREKFHKFCRECDWCYGDAFQQMLHEYLNQNKRIEKAIKQYMKKNKRCRIYT
jgi:hypothetical protein